MANIEQADFNLDFIALIHLKEPVNISQKPLTKT